MVESKLNKTELLAPAGGKEEFFAAIGAGADAVYTGLKKYSARKTAKNLDLEEAKELISYAHLLDKKVYLAINTLVYDFEIEEMKSMLNQVLSYNPDGIIVQDIGLFNYLKNNYDNVPLHASTQMTADNYYAVKNLYELGFERIVVAREMSIDEIKEIKDDFHVSIETFIHGALCVCYSGECYFSSALGTRSANRGDCAQPCRKIYQLIENGVETGIKGFFLSMKDLNTGNNLEAIARVSDSLKIEGRLKGKEYVFSTTSYYRHLLDGIKPTEKEEINVYDSFSRGFTDGFISNTSNSDMVNYISPKHRGSMVGFVTKADDVSRVKLTNNLYKGDGISFLTSDGKTSGTKLDKDYVKGDVLFVDKKLLKNSKVYRNFSTSLYEMLKSVHEPKKIKANFNVEAIVGEKLSISMYIHNRKVTIDSEYIVQEAKKPGDIQALFIEQLSRLGDTFFEADGFDFNIANNAFVPKSVINSIRRELVEKIIYEEPIIRPQLSQHDLLVSSNNKKNREKYISLIIDKMPNAKILSKLREVPDIREIKIGVRDRSLFNYFRNQGYKIVYKTPSILDKKEVEEIKHFIEEEKIDTVEINSYALLDIDCNIIIGDSLNVMNSEAIDFYSRYRVDSIITSREISYSEIKNLATRNSFQLRLPYYKKTISMVTKTLAKPIISSLESGKKVAIKDSKNEEFEIVRDRDKYLIFNSKPLFMARTYRDIGNCIIDIELDENFEQIIDFLYRGIDVSFEYTTGHYRRGV